MQRTPHSSSRLDAGPLHAMNSSSTAPRWVYDRGLELVTRAFTLSVRRGSPVLEARVRRFHESPDPLQNAEQNADVPGGQLSI